MSEPVSPIDTTTVQLFVANCHGDYGVVADLLGKHPSIVNASWDWGGGDWETGLGAAAHMGRGDIAQLLLDNGARMDIFAAAMLGKTELVKAFLDDDPSLIGALGPHGIPLDAHAAAGGSGATEVVALLAALRGTGVRASQASAAGTS